MASARPHELDDARLAALLAPITLSASSPRRRFENWGKTHRCTPARVFVPTTDFECELVLELARRHRTTVRAAGAGHSPSDLACTTGYLIRTDNLNRLLEVNVEKQYVVVQSGMSLTALHEHLATHGLAMSNLGSISEQSIAGVVTTATHGTGIDFKVIPSYVLSFTLLLANGSKVRCSRTDLPDLFLATLCGLGATGFVLSVQLQVEPAFCLREVQQIKTVPEVIENLDALAHASEHVRFWWFPSTNKMVVSSFDRTYESPNPISESLFHGFVSFHLVQLLLFLGRYVSSITPWAGRAALWFGRNRSLNIDVSHRIFNADCKYLQYTTEWAIPYEQARPCIEELRFWLAAEHGKAGGLRPHFPIEIRFSDSDDIPLSPSYGRKTCWIGIVQFKPYGFPTAYRELFQKFENIMSRHHGRPHWAKAHGLGPDRLELLYPLFHDFVDLLRTVDPNGTFRNEYVRRHIFGEDISQRTFKDRQS
ncbi:gulonolactone oxidase Lgo1 [Sistotremastrum suecicum HHB10207 ss-3]|uniref:D-arabinono-1,4-lactone oxidase n=1 Tax=Sistotremastrum suecicum HHB10207 ss-3 TaxID=1314776 RepID=A0A166C7W3_9AGAM|nr:gulonolactone oxidase Lgo1 [Sistotremastrum suecicum HHB10207 ss-3]